MAEPSESVETPRSARTTFARPLFFLNAGDIQLYSLCDHFSEILIYFALVFAPWAFGTTQRWSMWTMNVVGYVLGLLLGTKVFIRRLKGYRPPRWEPAESIAARKLSLFARVLFWVSLAVLLYCLVSALNARSTWHESGRRFEYHSFISWLPHSYDRLSTLKVFWNYTALACFFWAVRDWLLGKTSLETRGPRSNSERTEVFLPARLRRLLWVISINGALLGTECIVQRLSGTGKLLWLVEPHIHKTAESQFGPYAYRSNAAQYLNLVWPVCLGFWWMLHRSGTFQRWRHHALLLCAVVMAAAPIISTSRGGAFVALGQILGATLILLAGALSRSFARQRSARTAIVTLSVLGCFAVASIWLGLHFGGSQLGNRMIDLTEGYESRERTYEIAKGMARDFPLFGTGPGTFDPLFQMYRISPDEYWPVQLHNDWLETRITFGWLGSGLIAAAFLLVVSRWFLRGGIHGGRRFTMLLWLALAGCMVHARFDFPFQIYSVLFLFLVACAILFSVSRRGDAA